MLKNLILIALSIAFPLLFFFSVPYLIYLFLTVKPRSQRCFNDAIIWRTGGVFRTGDIDINKSVSLYKKASSMGHSEAAFHLGEMYSDGVSHVEYSGYLLEPNPNLAEKYFKRCQSLSSLTFNQLLAERERMINEIKSKYNFSL